MRKPNPKVDWFFTKAKTWQAEFNKLRTIMLSCELTEELKWGVPCYTFEGKNILLIHGFKEYCAVLFFKGALLKEAKGLLISQTANTQATRQIRFTSVHEVNKLTATLKACVREAIEVEKAGVKVAYKKTAEFKMPKELQNKFIDIPELKTAFEALTPGRQRGYLLYFSAPKQSKTRTARVEKYMDKIFEGKGVND